MEGKEVDFIEDKGKVHIEVVIVEGKAPAWMIDLDQRERDEVSHAMVYHDVYHHGTTGHLDLTIIAKLARKLNALEGYGDNDLKIISAEGVSGVENEVVGEKTLDPKGGDPDNRRYAPPLSEREGPEGISAHIYHPLSDRAEGEGAGTYTPMQFAPGGEPRDPATGTYTPPLTEDVFGDDEG